MVINTVFMIRLKNYSCQNVFNEENINTFDVLTIIQMRTVLTDKKLTSENDYTQNY